MARRKILDSCKLIAWWRKKGGRPADFDEARSWADELIALYGDAGIVSPVYLELLGGASTAEDARLVEAFLSTFPLLDSWQIATEDLQVATRIARRIPRNGRPRHLGDCLIRALADRLRCDVETDDDGFPPTTGSCPIRPGRRR